MVKVLIISFLLSGTFGFADSLSLATPIAQSSNPQTSNPVAVKALSITGPTSLMVENGQELSLDLVAVPTLLGEGADWANSRRQDRAIKKLEQLVKGKDIFITNKSPTKDRYGKFKANIVLAEGGDVAEHLLEEGLVALRHSVRPHPKWQIYLALEDKTRANKKGIWAVRGLAPACEEEAKFKASRYAIIAGDIEAVSVQREVIYINFTDNWREDFTVRIIGRGRNQLYEALKNKLQVGSWVEVRGWVSWTNGPLIDLKSGNQIRSLITRPNYCP